MRRVLATPADGTGPVTFFADDEVRPYALATDGVRIFWRDEAAGTIRARPADGSSAPVTVVTVPGGGTRGDVVVDDLRVYAVDSGAHVVVSAPR